MLRTAFLSLLASSFLGPSLYTSSKKPQGIIQSYKISGLIIKLLTEFNTVVEAYEYATCSLYGKGKQVKLHMYVCHQSGCFHIFSKTNKNSIQARQNSSKNMANFSFSLILVCLGSCTWKSWDIMVSSHWWPVQDEEKWPQVVTG